MKRAIKRWVVVLALATGYGCGTPIDVMCGQADSRARCAPDEADAGPPEPVEQGVDA